MPDSDKSLTFQVIIDLIGEGKLDEAKQKFEELKSGGEALDETMAKVGAGTASTGEKSALASEKHKLLEQVMGDLNRISPALGESLQLLSGVYAAAGEAAGGGAVGVAAFTTALEAALVTLGPLVIAMLGIEAVMKYWDMYKDKVAAAAKAQEEASKRIVESTHKARAAVEELEEAMHPQKKDTADQDEQNLKHQQQALENDYNRQRELNQTNEAQELKGAKSAPEKEQITKRFEVLDTQLNDWRDKQKAALEGAMVDTMNKQLADLEKNQDKLVEKSKEQRQKGDNSGYDATTGELKKNADEAMSIRTKLDDLTEEHDTDASNASFNSETHRQVFGTQGIHYQAPQEQTAPPRDSGTHFASDKFAEGKGIADLAVQGGKATESQQQFLILLEQTIAGHKLTFDQAVSLMERHSQNTEKATNILEHAHQRIETVSVKLQSLSQQMSNTPKNGC